MIQSVQMDVLSQLLQATRARSPVVADLRLGTDVSVGLPALGGVPFHYIAMGTCELHTADKSVELAAGDFVMLARVPYYRLQSGNGVTCVEAMDFAEKDQFSLTDLHAGRDQLLRREFGEGAIQARIFSAIMMFEGRESSPLIRDLPEVTLLHNTQEMLEPWLVAAIDFMSANIDEPTPGLSAVAERLIETIFIAVLRKWLLDGSHKQGWPRGLSDPALSRVLNAIQIEPGRHWTLRELAAVAGRSRSGLAQHFREIMGETPFAYLTRWRMDLAAAALARGQRSVADLGADLGYGGAAAFARTFQATFGQTPAQYRRQHRP